MTYYFHFVFYKICHSESTSSISGAVQSKEVKEWKVSQVTTNYGNSIGFYLTF